MLRAWMQASVPPAPQYETRPGRWVAEESWPSPRIEALRLAFAAGGLVDEAETAGRKRRGDIGQPLAPDPRADRRRVVSVRVRRRDADRPAGRGRPVDHLRQPAPRRATGDSRSTPGRARARRGPAQRHPRRAPQRRRPGWCLGAGHLRPAQPHPSPWTRGDRAPRAGGALSHQPESQPHRPRLSGGPPHPGGDFDHLLAAGLAVARVGHPHPVRRRLPARASGSPAPPPRRRAGRLPRTRGGGASAPPRAPGGAARTDRPATTSRPA